MPTRKECANAVRALSIDAIEKANSGHPGAPLGMADMGEALWGHFLKHNPADPTWPDRDIFVLSNGHASMFLYALLHLTGYDLPMEEIKNFRQWQSKTPGHPERGTTPGVEMTTGPLGQGIASAVGFALAEALLAASFNKPGYEIVNHYTYAFCGDGCLMEGVSHEACSLAGTWHLGKLILFYDDNGVSIDGPVNGWFTEDVKKRFLSYGWQVIGPIDGHDSEALDAAIREARSETGKPSLIICKTHIGFGSPKCDNASCHGAPLGEEAAKATKEALNWHEAPFIIPEEIRKAWDCRERGAKAQADWQKLFDKYEKAWPELALEFKRRANGELPSDWETLKTHMLDSLKKNSKPMATRISSRECLDFLAPHLPALIGGSADLSGSVGTMVKASAPIDYSTYTGNYIYYGVREFGMGAIMNGLAMHGGFIPYAGTFLAFSDQAKNALRLSALMRLRVIWVMTHDTIGVGEDGPTHQPIEQVSGLRLLPNLNVWRPCDSTETAQAWISALECADKPTCIVLSRQSLPQLTRSQEQIASILKGGYILKNSTHDAKIILISSGSEIYLALEAAKLLEKEGFFARVVSMPCTEIFDSQPESWKELVLPRNIRCRLAIEAASSDWWRKYTGLDGDVIGMDTFGASAPGSELFEHFGFTVKAIADRAKTLLAKITS